ncbi:MAG: hypothetical protein ACYCXN_05545, partial [Acidimicrobiales bacterium]
MRPSPGQRRPPGQRRRGVPSALPRGLRDRPVAQLALAVAVTVAAVALVILLPGAQGRNAGLTKHGGHPHTPTS